MRTIDERFMKVLGENGFIEAPTHHFYSPERNRFVEYYQGEWYSGRMTPEQLWDAAEDLSEYPDTLKEALERLHEVRWDPGNYPTSYETTVEYEVHQLQIKLSDL